jgi:DNA-directed RNA polymerase specialized sigma24 family protein
MVRTTASTRQPPAGGPQATRGPHGLLQELRAGDRDAFLRYFRLFRAPAYHVAWLLLRDEAAAAAATTEALVAAFRRTVLGEGGADLEVLTYCCALEACAAHARRDEREAPQDTSPEAVPRHHRRARGDDVRRRFAAALEGLEPRQRVALLLHDVAGLDAARSAAVLGVGEEVAAALVFRAREEFRAGLQAHHGAARRTVCRQAEEATARAVGLGLEEDELSRLRRHAAYCRTCRRTMRDWAGAGAGLALVLAEPALPQALATAPVFGDDVEEPATVPDPRRRAGAMFARTGSALRSRAAAWAVAVLCLAVAAGVVVHSAGVQRLILMQSVGPAIRLIVAPPDGAEPAAARSTGQRAEDAAPAAGVSAAAPVSRPSATVSPAPTPPATPETGSPVPADDQTVRDVTVAASDGVAAVAADKGPKAAKPKTAKAAKAGKATKKAKAAKAARATAKASGKAAKRSGKAARAGARSGGKAAGASGKAAKAGAKQSRKAARVNAKASSTAAKQGSKAAKANAKASKRSANASVKAATTKTKAGGNGNGHSGGSKKGG